MSVHDSLIVLDEQDKQPTQYQAYTEVRMEDAPKLLKIPISECPDIWIRLPKHKMAQIMVTH